ncbi:MAG: hypothetical protein NVSMB9_17220 [Isosphaeraceae bacterium]
MRYAAILLSILTIVSLNLILLLSAVVHDPQSSRQALNGLIAVFDLSLVSSSGLLGILFIKQQHRFLGALFFLNIGIFLVAYALRTLGVFFPPLLLYTADIYWLNLYLICLTRKFDRLFLTGS